MARRPAALVVLVVVSLLLAGCTTTGSSSLAAGPGSASGNTTAPPPADPELVFDTLQEYWRTAYPGAFGTPYVELRGGIHPLDSTAATGAALCIDSPAQILGNAFYCPDADGIVYDTGVLVPVLVEHYGYPGLVASLAHEFGHSVAARAGVATGSTLIKELQADCFAGNFLAATVPAELVAAMAPLLDFADQPAVSPTDPNAHGLAVDRAQAVQLGVRGGPTVCRDITTSSIRITLGTVDPDIATRKALASSAATTWQQAPAEADPTAAGCALGRSVRTTFPDEALNYLRARPDVTIAAVFGFLDGFAGRC